MFDLESLITTVGLLGVAGIVFAESGLLVGFFLPGDSLLFTAGFLAGQGFFDLTTLIVLCFIAAVAGDSVGYAFGHRVGRKLFQRPDSRWFKQEHLRRAEAFYDQHGGKTIILARFIPFVRTFAPVVAGVGKMHYHKFLTFNVVGGALWAIGLPLFGFWIGELVPNIDKYLIPVIGLIILLSILPGFVAMLKTPERRRGVWQTITGFFFRQPK